ncbi:testis-expressed protein 45 [Sphaerodactylus townsendi]|uniref:testis-expressed protein 45 n=1 Tax=Sphaerodactylus townsendi TaxID=933632 RepID=UPI002025D6AA|nr:testis-expressed protein 45 [Sphaerodactylus townsendi]
MEEPLQPEIPAPLHGHSFLQASHFQLGFDRRPEGSTVASSYRLDYPPRWGTFLHQPILPPKCTSVLNQDMGDLWEPRSEYLDSYPARPLAARPDVCLPVSCLQMHSDARRHVLTSTTQANYACPSEVLPTQPHRVDKWDDSIPEGDKEKVPLPPSLYQQSYCPHQERPAVRAPAEHLECVWPPDGKPDTGSFPSRGVREARCGSDSTLMGDGKVRFDSLYKSQYTGEWASPPNHCHQGLISVVFGDPRCRDAVSEHRHAYSAPHHAPHLCRYDANRAAQQVFQTNIPAGDGRQSFSTTMKEAFQWKDAGPAYASYPDKNMSSILRGDESAQKNKGNMSMSSFYFRELSIKDLKSQKPSSPKSRLAAPLGDRRLGSFSTTQQSDYRQPPQTRRAHVNSADLMKSNIAFNFPDTGISTTTQDMLLPHQLQKHPIPEDLLQKGPCQESGAGPAQSSGAPVVNSDHSSPEESRGMEMVAYGLGQRS